ncbi:1-deoxy-D-xylulose-5-phosphate reductoisomerase [Campylobacter sp. MIT 97-5078]|uniref:1-deoxy-D-xylulose-5-phosphate reductoisomerase n=1 Tax=Campylobacter sp. MIT 97-5078 TaxID=1548153 RepID=UPI00051467C0|nr:1-deoxy-D-xylulose-5-phosphate reductoisomerase [Campylobacter sp. MIT 97-5078]KGI55510.1 1-deoxy-D-xylulose 5-phosphate reductoisomerase [Campylobacter sp. MIT 97-5078]TQR27664.1 1-deoxy-D-xylulose-5-phosphate reductoisomerase [Campylobacter sp. MIT 97-5078]
MILFGSTGSIGQNVLFLAKKHKIKINALACGENIKLFKKQIAEFKPEFICIKNKQDRHELDFNPKKIFYAQEGLEHILNISNSKLVVNAIVGFAGLRASIQASKLKKTLALANKESLVVAGKFLKHTKIKPIDSEHAALKCLLKGQKNIEKLYITASGGAFFKRSLKELSQVSAKEALQHPNWNMGAKITIDSATMVNKLFEIIEAYHLFGFKNLDAIIEPKSLAHAICEFKDGGASVYFSKADMRLAISQAILKKKNQKILQSLDFVKLASLKFHHIDLKKYPIFSLKKALLENVDLGVIINATNEVLVKKFLNNECKFLDIANGIFKTLDHFENPYIKDIDEVFELDKKVREFIKVRV